MRRLIPLSDVSEASFFSQRWLEMRLAARARQHLTVECGDCTALSHATLRRMRRLADIAAAHDSVLELVGVLPELAAIIDLVGLENSPNLIIQSAVAKPQGAAGSDRVVDFPALKNASALPESTSRRPSAAA